MRAYPAGPDPFRKTPVLTAEVAGELLRSIEKDSVVGLRDRGLNVGDTGTDGIR